MGWEGTKGPPYKFGMGPSEGLIRPCLDPLLFILYTFFRWITFGICLEALLLQIRGKDCVAIEVRYHIGHITKPTLIVYS